MNNSPLFLLDGFELKPFGVGQTFESATVGNRWCMAAAKQFRGDGEVKLVHPARAEQGIIQFATPFAEQPFHPPLLPQPPQRGAEIDFFPAANFHRVGQRAQLLQPAGASTVRGEDNNGREPMPEHLGAGID